MGNALHTYLGIAPQSSEAGILRLLIELGAQVVGATEGSLLVHDLEEDDLVFAMTVGGDASLIGQRIPLNKGLTGLAAATREVQIGSPTFQLSTPQKGSKEPPAEARAVIAAPMLVNDELVGVLTAVSFTTGKSFSADHGDLYGRLASVAAVVVHQRRQLAAFSAREGGEAGRNIADSVARIAAASPEALGRVARVLGEMEGLVSASWRKA